MNHTPAREIAENILRNLAPFCERIEIAGSLRRLKPVVGDIEIVCIPRIEHTLDLFGEVVERRSLLDAPLFRLAGDRGWQFEANGPRYKKINLGEIKLDLFLVLPPAQWGVIYTIRTGPAEFSQWIVIQRLQGGCLPDKHKVHSGNVYPPGTWRIVFDDGQPQYKYIGRPLEMPEEMDFLNFLGLGWVEPAERVAGMQVWV